MRGKAGGIQKTPGWDPKNTGRNPKNPGMGSKKAGTISKTFSTAFEAEQFPVIVKLFAGR